MDDSAEKTPVNGDHFGADKPGDDPRAAGVDLSTAPGKRFSRSPTTDTEAVYRRLPDPDSGKKQNAANIRARAREIAPTALPLLIGFALLLVVTLTLGVLSVRRMEEVSSSAKELQQQHSARTGLLLKLRLALTELNNEARNRHDAESRRELKPPFYFPLGKAREEVVKLMRELDAPPLADDPTWQRFRQDLQSFVEVTEDLRRYSLEGYSKFAIVSREVDALLAQLAPQQDQISAWAQAREEDAARSIRVWTLIALLIGAVVAAATMWEVQRWFRRMRVSMVETQRERAFTTQLLEGMVSAVAAIDENDRIRSANEAFFKIFPSASIGASIHEEFGPADAMKMLSAATVTRVDTATYRGRWVTQIEGESIQKTFDVYSSPLAINGDRGQILTLVDATAAAEGERVLRRSESLAAVGRATTQVAHEIRNPLGSIRLGVSMLRDSVNDAEALRTIELVERGIKHLNKLVVDVTQFSRQKALERADVDLHELLESSLDLVSARVKDKHTPVEKRYTEQRLVGRWDADQLRQVFVNVLANAIDASPEKSPLQIFTETVSLESRENGGGTNDFAQITIADQGVGMDQATIDRVFEPFFSTKKRGTGLGLAIVKQIVEQHSGRITINSEPGNGARVVIDLPL
jgi:signal transduction histidine kinase